LSRGLAVGFSFPHSTPNNSLVFILAFLPASSRI
jgi:hypothetical protein